METKRILRFCHNAGQSKTTCGAVQDHYSRIAYPQLRKHTCGSSIRATGSKAAFPGRSQGLALCLRTWLVARPDCCGLLALQPLGTNVIEPLRCEQSQGDAYA